MADLIGRKIIILATQQKFSGDGARTFADLFDAGAIEVIQNKCKNERSL